MIPREFKEHLKHREGYRDEVYLDTLGKPTCGVGHLLTEQECRQYDVGERVPQHVIDRWLEQDTEVAWQAALMQSQDLGIDSFEFTVALGSVNFQLGTRWMNSFLQLTELYKIEIIMKLLDRFQQVLEEMVNLVGWNKLQ